MLVEELNTVDFEIEFHGMPLDWDDFEDAFTQAKQDGKIKNLKLQFQRADQMMILMIK